MTISSQIIEVLDDLCRRFGIVVDWSAENVLPYIQELAGKYVFLEIATSKMWIVAMILMLIIGVILFVIDIKTSFADGLCAFFGVCLAATAIAVIIVQVYDIITCVHFPEKMIFDYVSELLRTKGVR